MQIVIYTHPDDRKPEVVEYWASRCKPTVGGVPYKIHLLRKDQSGGVLMDRVFEENDQTHDRKRVLLAKGDQLLAEVSDSYLCFHVTNMGNVDDLVDELFGEEEPDT